MGAFGLDTLISISSLVLLTALPLFLFVFSISFTLVAVAGVDVEAEVDPREDPFSIWALLVLPVVDSGIAGTIGTVPVLSILSA